MMEFDRNEVLEGIGGLYRDAVEDLALFFCEAINPLNAKKELDGLPWETHVGLRCVYDCLLAYEEWLGYMKKFAETHGVVFDRTPMLYYDYEDSFRNIIGTEAGKAVKLLSRMIKNNGFDNKSNFKMSSDRLIRKIKEVNLEIPQIVMKGQVVPVEDPFPPLEGGDFVADSIKTHFKEFADVLYKP